MAAENSASETNRALRRRRLAAAGSPAAAAPADVTAAATGRLVSLDAYRGFIMMMLAAGGFGLAAFCQLDPDYAAWTQISETLTRRGGSDAAATVQRLRELGDYHFTHPQWGSASENYGVAFWDLIQPAFMLMVGVSMPFSAARRRSSGEGLLRRVLHVLVRAVVLVVLGVFLSTRGSSGTHWVFPNVLCQIGLGYSFVCMFAGRRLLVQFAAVLVVLGGSWALFYLNPPLAGYDSAAMRAELRIEDDQEVLVEDFAAWSKNANIASRFDNWLLPQLRDPDVRIEESLQRAEAVSEEPVGFEPALDLEPLIPTERHWYHNVFFTSKEPFEVNRGGYTTLNFIPSMATMLLGAICGTLLIDSSRTGWKKLGLLLVLAAGCYGLGIAADMTVCPIVKRIWTPSWVLFSGGFVIGMLALFYLLFDLLPLKFAAFPLVVVGTNSLLTYVIGQTVSGWVRQNIVVVHLSGLITSVFGPEAMAQEWYRSVTVPTAGFVVVWLFLLWLYRQRVFLRV